MAAPGQLRRQDEVLLAERQEAPSNLARQGRPADEGEDDGNRKEHLFRSPVLRQAAVIISQIGMVGSDCRISISRWMTRSIQPPKYPERPPRSTPRIVLSATATRPTVMEVRVPNIMRDHWSRPKRSVPRKCGRPLDCESFCVNQVVAVRTGPARGTCIPHRTARAGSAPSHRAPIPFSA